MTEAKGEQLSFEDSSEVKIMISERCHWMDVESYYLDQAGKAREQITLLTYAIADSRAIDSQRPYGRTYTSLDLVVPAEPTPLDKIFAGVLGARRFFHGKRDVTR